MKEYLKEKFSRNSLSIDDLVYLSRLDEAGMATRDIIDILSNKKNRKIFDDLSMKLTNGMMIEEAIGEYLPEGIKEYLLPLLKKLSFSEALSLSLQFHDNHERNRKEIASSLAYPCVLLMISVTAIYLFDIYGIDTIFNLIAGFDADLSLMIGFRKTFRIIVRAFYYLCIVVLVGLLIFTKPKRIALLYVFISKHWPNSLFHLHYSEEFVSLLLICTRRGYKTKEALETLRNMKSRPLVSFMAYHLDESLLEGETLDEASRKRYYDQSLSRFIRIASHSDDFAGMLENYTLLARERFRRKMKEYTLAIQILTYAFIGMIVIFIYQVLYLPMQAIMSF